MTCSCSKNARCCVSKLSVCSLGFSIGILWALGILLVGIASTYYPPYGNTFVNMIGSVYVGYTTTPQGIAIGTGWAFVDGFICGVLIAWLYNTFNHLCHCCCRQKGHSKKIEVKSLSRPDEERTLPKTKIEVVNIGPSTLMRVTFEPGWKWSECVKPTVGTQSCLVSHVNYIVSGSIKILMDDGTEKEVGPGDAMFVPPGHDAWVIGDVPCVALDFTAGKMYGKK